MMSFRYVWLFGTKSDVMVTAGRYELVHISTDATNTSRLPKADTHNEMYFFLLIIIEVQKISWRLLCGRYAQNLTINKK
mgnify:CR=1 FL=1